MFNSPFLIVHKPSFDMIQLPLKVFFVSFERASTKNLLKLGLDFPISGVLTLNNWFFGRFRTLMLDHDIGLMNGCILKLLLYDRLWHDHLCGRRLNWLGLILRWNIGQILIHSSYKHLLLRLHLNRHHRLFELCHTLINKRVLMKIDLRLIWGEHLLLVFRYLIGLLHYNTVCLFYNLPFFIWNYLSTLLLQNYLGHLLVLLI